MNINEVNKKSFVIFNLYTLRLNVSYRFLLNCLIDYFIISVLKDKYGEKKLFYYFKENILPESSEEYATILLEYKYLHKTIRGFSSNNFNYSFLRYRIIKLNNSKYIKQYNSNDAKVIIYLNLLTDILDKNVLEETSFRVLCAIFSVLGNSKKVKVITNAQINHRINGLMSEKYVELELKATNRPLINIKNRPLKAIIESLGDGTLSRHFFARRRDGRKYYYSKYLKGSKLEYYIAALKLKRKAIRDETNYNNQNVKNIYKVFSNKGQLSKKEFEMVFNHVLEARGINESYYSQIRKTIKKSKRKQYHKY